MCGIAGVKYACFTVGKDRACKSTTFGTKVVKRTTGSMLDYLYST